MPLRLVMLLMLLFECDLPIIEAIDKNMEWFKFHSVELFARYWYNGKLGGPDTGKLHHGTFLWPGQNNRVY